VLLQLRRGAAPNDARHWCTVPDAALGDSSWRHIFFNVQV
jgi:hypothetical protein